MYFLLYQQKRSLTDVSSCMEELTKLEMYEAEYWEVTLQLTVIKLT
jgi:hypothetical protein